MNSKWFKIFHSLVHVLVQSGLRFAGFESITQKFIQSLLKNGLYTVSMISLQTWYEGRLKLRRRKDPPAWQSVGFSLSYMSQKFEHGSVSNQL